MTITPKDWKDSPDATTPISQAALEDLESRMGAYTDTVASNPLAIVRAGTVFPSSPTDGQLFSYNADTTNGVKWMFQYRAASASAYKWEFIGGPPLFAEALGLESVVSATYAALTTPGPSLTVPIAGDYIVEIGGRVYNDTAGRAALMSYDIGATGAVDADAVVNYSAAISSGAVAAARARRKTGLAAATALVSKYKTDGAGTVAAQNRWMTLLPIRTSG